MVLVPNASKGIFLRDFSSCVVGQNVSYLYLRRVKIPVSPGLRSVLVWVLQGGCFLASYLNAPQMEMVRVVAWEPTAKSGVEQNVRSVLSPGQKHQAGYGRSTNFILPRAASHSENGDAMEQGSRTVISRFRLGHRLPV